MCSVSMTMKSHKRSFNIKRLWTIVIKRSWMILRWQFHHHALSCYDCEHLMTFLAISWWEILTDHDIIMINNEPLIQINLAKRIPYYILLHWMVSWCRTYYGSRRVNKFKSQYYSTQGRVPPSIFGCFRSHKSPVGGLRRLLRLFTMGDNKELTRWACHLL